MTAVRTATRIQDMDDANITPAEGVDGYAFVYDHASETFVLDSMEYNRVVRTALDFPEYGPDLITNGAFAGDFTGWTAGAGWSVVGNKAKHTSGAGTATLSQAVTQPVDILPGRNLYKLLFTISGRTSGSVSVSLAGVVSENIWGTAGERVKAVTIFDFNAVHSAIINAASADASIVLLIIPTTDFDGSIDDVSLTECGFVVPFLSSVGQDGGTPFEVYGKHDISTLGIGRRSLQRNLGFGNTAMGVAALSRCVIGQRNSAFGEIALAMLTVGSGETAVGINSLLADVSGWRNTAVGADSAAKLLTGYRNTVAGAQSVFSLLRGDRNTVIGAFAGAVLADGVSLITELNDCVFIGTEIRSPNNAINEIAIGTGAIGLGSNTTVIGNSSTEKTALFGALRIPQLASAPTGEAGHALVYAIDNGSGKMKFCVKLGDDVEIVLATQS